MAQIIFKMEKKRAYQLAVTFFIIFSFWGYYKHHSTQPKNPKSYKGVMDLTQWNFEDSGVAKLDGQWEIYWGELLSPKEINLRNAQLIPDYIELPNSTKGKTFKGNRLPEKSFGTIKLTVKTNPIDQFDYYLRIIRLMSASKIYVNGVLVSETGNVSTSTTGHKSSWKQSIVNTGVKNSNLEIVIQMSKFTNISESIRSLSLGDKENILEDYVTDIAKDIFIFGTLFFMGIYHLFLYFKRKNDKSTLLFGLTALFMSLRTLLMGTRFIYEIFPNINNELLFKLSYISIYFIVLSYFMFLKEVFDRISNRFITLTRNFILFLILITVTTNIAVYNKFLLLFEIWCLLGLIYILTIIIKEIRNKNHYGLMFIIGFFIIFTSAIYDMLIELRIINANSFLPVGLFIFMFFQSYIIASKFSNAFTHAETLTEEVKELNNELEIRVEERTKELRETIEELKKSQEKIIRSEKMAALGQLIAGIAHEINTPLGAIRASIGNISDSFTSTLPNLPTLTREMSDEQLTVFQRLIKESLESTNMLMGREARKIKKEHIKILEAQGVENADYYADALIDMGIERDIDYLAPLFLNKEGFEIMKSARDLCLIQKNSKNIETAVDKAAKVVYALKIYAHHEESKTSKQINIKENIEVVLTLYNNQIKQGVEVIREYDEVSDVWGFSDELNQVWTNIIHNAIQAMNNQGNMTIKIFEENNFVKVAISDTGHGISEDNMKKIFDPFFTTKKIGEGTGLGLDIVKKIIDKHEGFIECISKEGEGTTFIVSIPVIEKIVI